MPLNDSYARVSSSDRIAGLGLRAVLAALHSRDPRVAAARGARLGAGIHRLDPRWRRLAEQQLQTALPELDAAAVIRENYRHYGRILAELACHRRLLQDPDLFVIEGAEHAAALTGGGLLITAHLGNWELLAAAHTRHHGPLHALVKPLRNGYIDDWINDLRRLANIRPMETRDNALPVLRLLRGGGTIAVLADQNSLRHEGVFVPFFGQAACTHYGPAMLALRAGAPVVTAFGWRLPDGRHAVRYDPPLAVPTDGDLRSRTWRLTAALTARIETAVRRTPEQWFWVHRRWKNQPNAETESWRRAPEAGPDKTGKDLQPDAGAATIRLN